MKVNNNGQLFSACITKQLLVTNGKGLVWIRSDSIGRSYTLRISCNSPFPRSTPDGGLLRTFLFRARSEGIGALSLLNKELTLLLDDSVTDDSSRMSMSSILTEAIPSPSISESEEITPPCYYSGIILLSL